MYNVLDSISAFYLNCRDPTAVTYQMNVLQSFELEIQYGKRNVTQIEFRIIGYPVFHRITGYHFIAGQLKRGSRARFNGGWRRGAAGAQLPLGEAKGYKHVRCK